LLLKLEQKQRALDVYSQALPFSQKVGDKGLLLTTLYNLARANFELGSLDVALSWIQESLKMIEDVRTNVASPEFRASYFSGAKKHYELCIAILMQLDRTRPGEGFAAEAFLVSENSRARLLLDLLSESQAGLRHGASAELLKRERELRGSVGRLAQYELDLSFKKKDSGELREVGKELAELRAEYQAVQAQLRERRSDEAPLDRFEPVDLQRIQAELRDNDALLLQYSLGEKRSYLWAVTADSFTVFELPPRKEIEEAAIEVYKLLTARQESEKQSNKDFHAKVEAADRLYYEKAPHLSEMLLGPVAQQLGNRKVLVVAEGALHYIPFGALPVPGTQARGPQDRPLLIETNEINRSPSISALIAIRAEKKQPRSTDKVVAVVADPVFNRNDERVQSEGSSSTITSAASNQPENASVAQAQVLRDLGGADGPPRLLHSSEEADAISAAAPRGTTMVAKGFEATREMAMSQRIGEYQIVHFATHGFFYNKHPELSGIVMTMVDRAGTEKNGVMPLHDIYSLDLSAELTVLSACQTGLGRDVSGEGLVGLTHSFMSAGSNTVVASLWKVDDRATANLMAEFYRAMLQEGMPTGAALRAAKLKMMQDKRWHAPYFWAGFVLQGEYTNQIVVDRSSRFSIRTVLLLLVPIFAGSLIFYWLRRRLVRARRM
ncbi:MAG TPA: CHAT domain-containing protein, partial [Pyrinomonadaceae bacterium]